jgi:hypothetical protein
VSTVALGGVLTAWDGSDDAAGPVGLLGVWVGLGLASGFVGRAWLPLVALGAGTAALVAYGVAGERYGDGTWALNLAIVRSAEATSVVVGARMARRRAEASDPPGA